MNNKYSFERIVFSDYAEVVKLVNSSYRGDSSMQGWTTEAEFLDGQRTDIQSLTDELKNPHKTLLCLRIQNQPEIIGTVLLEKTNDEKGPFFYLGMLTIKPAIQNGGLGKWMIDKTETFVKSEGLTRIKLSVLNPRVELMSWYERRGYRRNGACQPFPYGEEKFGVPKINNLHFVMFEKTI